MKSTTFKIAYFIFILIISLGLISELYLVIDRRLSNQEVKKSALVKDNIFTQRLKREDDAGIMETLWETPWEKYRANAELDGIIGNKRISIKINSHGYRTKEFEIEKPKDVYRIICIGASTTYEGITNDTTYPAILDKKLKKRYPGKKFEVLNFGISGSRSYYWISRLDELFKFQPDMIIQYNAVNEISGRYLSRIDNTCTGRKKLTFIKAFNMSFLYQKIFPLDPSLMDGCFMLTFNIFNQIASESKARGAEYVVGAFAAPDYSKADKIGKDYLDYSVQRTWGKGLYLKYYSSYYNLITRFNSHLRQYANQHNINLVPVDSSVTDPTFFTDVCHMTQQGIEIKAQTFYDGVINILDKKFSLP